MKRNKNRFGRHRRRVNRPVNAVHFFGEMLGLRPIALLRRSRTVNAVHFSGAMWEARANVTGASHFMQYVEREMCVLGFRPGRGEGL
jgi:hypothetical protein